MQVSRESRRTRWLMLAGLWLAAAVIIGLQTGGVLEYVRLLDGLGLRGAERAETPLRQVIPARHADAQSWVRHVLTARETGSARVRFTQDDNAPHGREVHWSSAFAWLLRGAAAVSARSLAGGETVALERTLLWFNAPLLWGLVLLVSTWVARRAGAIAGVLIGLGMLAHQRWYEVFAPTNVDHHGLVVVSIFGLIFGVVLMGGGWWRRESNAGPRMLPPSVTWARGAAIGSALWGAFGMWLSAAALLPAIALVGVAGLATTVFYARPAGRLEATFAPEVWRLWGRTGALASFACYLIEYAPADFALRMEVIHPLYSAAWWGGAEFVAVIGAWWTRRAQPGGANTSALGLGPWVRALGGPLVAVALPAAVIALGGASTFLVSDPFVGQLRHFVAEGMTTPECVRRFGLRVVAADLVWLMLLLPPAVALLVRRRAEAPIALGLVTFLTVAFAAMGVLEMRWWVSAGAAELGLLLVLAAQVPLKRRGWRLLGFAAVLLLLLWPAAQRIVNTRAENARHAVSDTDLLGPLFRDVAGALRASQPDGPIVLLANPNASAGIGYFGRFRSLGTLYWENAPGLRAAAELFSARTDAEALELIRRRGVTHVVMISPGNFLGEYFQLLHPSAAGTSARETFGYRLATARPPQWLQPLPYRPPEELRPAATSVALYQVVFDQSEVEWLYHRAIAAGAQGDTAAAERLIGEAWAQATPPDRMPLLESAATWFYEYSEDALAARLFRRGVEAGYHRGFAVTLAWILATTRDPGLRDGRAALELIEPIRREQPDDVTTQSAFAAACADVGRLGEAVRATERAIQLARAANDLPTVELLRKRLEVYRSGRAWTQ